MIIIFFTLLLFSRKTTDEIYKEAIEFYRNGYYRRAANKILEVLERNPKDEKAKSLYNEILKHEAKRLYLSAMILYEEKDLEGANKKKKEARSYGEDVLDEIVKEEILKIKKFLKDKRPLEAKLEVEKLYFIAPERIEVLKLKRFIESKFFSLLLKEYKNRKKEIVKKSIEEAKINYQKKLYLPALEKLKLALEYDPNNKDARKLLKKLNKVIIEIGRKKGEKEKKKIETKVRKYILKMKKYFKKKKYEKVIKLGKKVLNIDPENKEIEPVYTKAVESYIDKRIEESFRLYQKGKIKKAKKIIEELRDLNVSFVKKKAGDFVNEAEKIGEKGKSVKGLLIGFATLLDPTIEKKVKLSMMEEKVELKGVWDEYHKGDYRKVLSLLEELKKKNPENKNIKFIEHLTNAQIALDGGDFKRAREELIQAVRINPLHEEVWGFFERLEEVIEILGI